MRKEQIFVGASYVNERAGIMREVVEELDERTVRITAFDLKTGKLQPTRHNIWKRSDLARWADRKAGRAEVERAHPYQEEALFGILIAESPGSAPVQQAGSEAAAPEMYMFPRGK